MKRKAQIWDQIEYFGEDYNNFQMYASLDFDGKLNENILEKAVRLCFDIFPVLRSRYAEGRFRACWRELERDSIPEFFFLVHAESEGEPVYPPQGCITNAHAGPQVRIRLTRRAAGDSLFIVMNHMICDAAGFKRYLYTLSDLYSKLLINPDYKPGYTMDGSRSGIAVYRGFIRNAKGVIAKAAALFQFQQYRNFRNEISLPGGGDDSPFIASLSISGKRFDLLKGYCREQGVTINDVFLAAFYRSVALHFPDTSDRLTIPFMIDLRRFLPDGEPDSLCNLTSTIRLSLGNDIGESVDETVRRIHQESRQQLANMDVMNGYLHLLTFFELLPYPVFRKFIDMFFHSFPIAFSNIGILDSSRLRFGEAGLENCWMTGSIKEKPCFWFALSSFNGRITMTINLNGSAADKEFTGNFLKAVEQNLPV